ncbi:helix-turn-helix domain containing protein [Bacillus thuringiensis]|nr:helix-turn-helix domain containing protein [Bacillus thuringiensis]
MHDFFNSLIHDKSTRRRLFILYVLDNEKKFVSANSIATKLHCSTRTISSDISKLKKELPRNWKISGIKTKGYILKKPINESLHPIINLYIKESNITKIILEIFNNKHYSLEKWSQLLYTNKLTLKQNLKHHFTLLQKNNLNINFRNLQLEGNEIHVRHYFHIFFYALNVLNGSPLSSSDKILINKLSKILNSYNMVIDLHMLESIIWAFINRYSYKNFITKIDTSLFLKISNFTELEWLHIMTDTIESHYKITFPKNEKITLKLFFFLMSVSNLEQGRKTIEFLKCYDQEHYNKYLGFFKTFTAGHNITDDEKNKLTILLAPYYYKSVLHSHFKISREFYFNPKDILTNEQWPMYKKKLNSLLSWNESGNRTILIKNEFECLITNAIILIEPFIEKINILFLYSGTTGKLNVYQSRLKRKLGERVKIHTNFNNNFSYDFIITNTPKENVNTPIIYISETLSPMEITFIKNFIFKK